MPLPSWFTRLRRAAPKAKAADLEAVKTFRACFGTDAGQRVLEHLFVACHMDSSVHAPDAMAAAYMSGKRDLFLYLINILEAEHE